MPAFRRVASSYAINELGNVIGEVALAILVFDRTKSALATAATFVTLRAFPAMLAPLLTARLEIVTARRVLPLLYLSEGAIFGAIAFLAHGFSLPAVLVLSAIDGVLAITARALIRSVTGTLLSEPGKLRRGNTVITAGVTVANSFGPVLGGVLVAGAGAGLALAIDAGSFALAAAILFSATQLPIASDHEATTAGRLRAGLSEAWTRPAIRRLLIGAALAMLFGSAVIPIEVIFAKRTLHAGDSGYGLLITAWGIGMVVGSAVLAATNRFRLNAVLAGGIGLIAAGYLGLALSPSLAVACLFSALGGVGNTLWVTSVTTALQEAVSATAQSAVMALLGSIYQVAPAIGFMLGGAATALGSPRTAYGLAAIGVAAVLIGTLAWPAAGTGAEDSWTQCPDNASEDWPGLTKTPVSAD